MATSSSPSTRLSSQRSTPLRRLTAVALTALLSLGLVLVASPAHAEDGYRYWNYFHVTDDAFEFAQTGPADVTPKDGDVEGWRYGLSSESAGIEPRADLTELTFDSICEGTEAGAEEKRVALLIDYGTEADAAGGELPEPTAECAVVPTKATGLQTLESVTDVRAEDGGICALDGYPAKGCFETVKDAEVDTAQDAVAFKLPEAAAAAAGTDEPADEASAGDASETSSDTAADEASESGIGWPLVAVLVIAVVLTAVAIPLYRRNRES